MREQTITKAEDLANLDLSSAPMTESQLAAQLVKAGLLDRSQLKQVFTESHRRNQSVVDTMSDLGFLDQSNYMEAVATRLGIPLVHISSMVVDVDVVNSLPSHLIETYRVFPLGIVDNRLFLAMPNPCDIDAVHTLSFASKLPIDVVMSPLSEIESLIQRYLFSSKVTDILSEFDTNHYQQEQSKKNASVQALEEKAKQEPVIKFVDSLLHEAVIQGVSDINIRPNDSGAKVYYRVDGKEVLQRSLTFSQVAPIVARIKIISGMNIAERRLPQDGNTAVEINRGRIDFRVSCIPLVNGESIVIRILDSSKGLVDLDALGLPKTEIKRVRSLLTHSFGMFLVTGPTGSGKSTTLYAIIQERLKGNPHIMTVEDPVEYRLEGVEQIQVKPAIGYTFAEALKHILRHDPDEILIGEIRDQETAEIAVKAALTGHFVMSTLHTNDAASTVTRLADMGIEPYLINSSLIGVLAQRLVRKVCSECAQPDPDVLKLKEFFHLPDTFSAMIGTGCSNCFQTGYRGRLMVGELLAITPSLKDLVTSGANADELREQAIVEGMISMHNNTLDLVKEGKTSLQEVYRIKAE